MTLKYNLQFFAKEGPGGEKTEPATPKKLQDARRKGQVAKSKEVGNALGLLGLFLILKVWVGNMGTRFLEMFDNVYQKIPEVIVNWNGYLPENDMSIMFRQLIIEVLLIVAPIFAVAFILSFMGDYVQIKWQITTQPLKPKFNKLNPISGFKRILSVNSLVELAKAILKIILIGFIVYNFIKDKWSYLYLLYDMPLMQAIQLAGELVTDLGIQISAVYAIIAFGDYIYQKYKFKNDMKMTKQEVKDEYKQQEGDPQVKGKIRSKMQEASRRRMMQNLPKADVVITNPTHYAVAIQYDPEIADAPIVLAKGEDYMARKIKEVAKEHNIEIVENKPLARMLYANVEVGQVVPPELYQAVAEVLAFVYHLKGKV
ncbi:MAG: flagellar biosynthesis protein FlhB [Lachnospiraceae bacterium]|nr:flagellar biosynthesis protein FlhB [Lachnospiraceae bacterium]